MDQIELPENTQADRDTVRNDPEGQSSVDPPLEIFRILGDVPAAPREPSLEIPEV